MNDDIYEVYAIKYGFGPRRSSENFIGGDPHDTDMPLDYSVWAIRNEARTIVVDTGFSAKSGAERGRQMVTHPAEGLKRIGVDPDSVTDVILTHLHYDHAGNIDLFPRARFHLQDCEMQFATGRCMCHALMRHPFEVDDIVTLVRRLYGGDVQFHDGDAELAPGVTLHFTGGHSKGLQAVRVKTRRGYVMVASDTAHFFRHLDERRVFTTTYNVGDTLEGYNRIEALATSHDHIIPGHDPLVLSLYPSAGPGLEGVAARLDVDPKPRERFNAAKEG